jgi:hypothetical protein
MMTSIARLFIVTGLIFLVVGGLIYLAGRINLPIGRLPGDIRIERDNFSLFVPLGTSILLSIVLTLILNIVIRWLGRR